MEDYCECPQGELNYMNVEIAKHFHECPVCHKQDYGSWWANEMNKNSILNKKIK